MYDAAVVEATQDLQLVCLGLVPDLPVGSTTDPSVAYFKERTKTFAQLIDGVEMVIIAV